MTSEFDKIADIEEIVKGQAGFKKRYSDIEVIGEGGMGKVFRARDNKLAKLVAIKFLHSNADNMTILRFQQEARALSRLNHQFIVQVLDFQHSEEGELFLVLEYVNGKSLESILEEKGALSFSDAIRYGIQLCDALDHAHVREIVHRDLKPSNILIDADNNVRILDFGIAKLLSDNLFGTLTRPGQMMGTPLYMSPEQVRGEDTDSRTDIYGLGVILYAMLAGRTPWDGDQLVVMFRDKASGEPPSLGDCIGETAAANALDRIVSTALRNDPDNRFQTMKEFREALCEVVVDPLELKQIIALPTTVRKAKKVTPLTVSIAALALCLLSGVSYSLLTVYSKVKAPINADLKKVAAPNTSLSTYDVVQLARADSDPKAATGHSSYTTHPSKKKDPDGFFQQTERRDQRDFWFAHPSVNDETLAKLSPRIQELSLLGNKNITDTGLRAIPAGQLKKIDLTETNITGESLKIIARMKNLRWIRLDRTAVTDVDLKHLEPLSKGLLQLDLDECKGFTDSGLNFVLNHFPNLYGLHIGDTKVSEDGIRSLSKHPNLRDLWLSSLPVTDDDLRALQSLNLRLLDLSDCIQITDDIFTIFANHRELIYLELISCPKITADGVALWKKSHPHCTLHWQNTGEAKTLTDSGLFEAPEPIE